MKTTLSIFFILVCLNAFSQNLLKIKEIDSIVSVINESRLPVTRDTLKQDLPEYGIKMTTYLAMVVSGKELMKYVNNVNSIITQNGVAQQASGVNSFYYHHNKLIKVEEYLIDGGIKNEASWYYADDKSLYYTLQADKAEARAALLLEISKTMLKQIIK